MVSHNVIYEGNIMLFIMVFFSEGELAFIYFY